MYVCIHVCMYVCMYRAQCGVWCRYSDDPEGYHHSTLPGQKDLQGDELRLLLTDVLLSFAKNEVATKLAPLGAT